MYLGSIFEFRIDEFGLINNPLFKGKGNGYSNTTGNIPYIYRDYTSLEYYNLLIYYHLCPCQCMYQSICIYPWAYEVCISTLPYITFRRRKEIYCRRIL